MGSGNDFEEMGGLLARRFRLIAPDLPGHGNTAHPDHPRCSMQSCADALIEWLDGRGTHRPHLWGYSMGGRLALYLALHYPGRFDRVILESASPGLAAEDQRKARREHDEALARRLETEPLADLIESWFDQPLFASLHEYPAKLEAMKKRRLECDRYGLAASLRHMGTGVMPSLWNMLPSLALPTLLIVGGRDSKFVDIGRRMRQRSDRFTLKQLEGAGHNVHFERPQQVAHAIVEYLS
jgi:2-succinyl-6-hydroxy-2,4-cyclohexadiene-1-carboxylate synthase